MNPRIAHYALVAGLCALIPLPFLDEWAERRALRSMLLALAADAGRPLDEATLRTLTEDRSSVLVGCLGMAILWPLKKLFRTAFYFLTLKDVVDGVTRAALVAAMVHAAWARLPGGAVHVRDTVDATLGRWQYSPVSRVLLRGERPDTTWVATGHAGRFVGWLYEKGGGGAILADFERRLAETAA